MGAAARPEVAVIGAGWAGLAAAIRLVKGGRRVRLIDAAPQAGGRARRISLDWKHPQDGDGRVELDNGQHLLLGAYTEVMALLEIVGALDDEHLERRPMRLASSSGLLMERPVFSGSRGSGGASTTSPTRVQTPLLTRLLNPLLTPLLNPLSPLLALVRAQGLSPASRWAMLRALAQLRLGGWRTPAGVTTVSDWYLQARQPAELIDRIWQPLAISALNTPADSACATTFLAVLRDSLGAGPGASDFILPRRDLSHLFVEPALDWLRSHGAILDLRTDIRRIERGERMRYRVVASDRVAAEPLVVECDELVLATPPYASARLLGGLADAALVGELKRFQYLPITTAYLGWPEAGPPGSAKAPAGSRHPEAGGSGAAGGLALPALLALRESAAEERYAQWFFDRGRQSGWRIAALVVSDSRAARELGDRRLTDALIRQVVAELGVPAPTRTSLIHEKRATFACTPDRPRLGARAACAQLPGLMLAGDYTYGDYPATLEGAVRSGRLAAQALVAN